MIRRSHHNSDTRHPIRWIRAVLALALLAVYGYSALTGHIHVAEEHHFHSDATETCSADLDEDPCHQAIYHKAEKTCDHDVHLFAALKSCELCDVLLSQVQQTSDMDGMTVSDILHDRIVHSPAGLICLPARKEIQLRGPPGLV